MYKLKFHPQIKKDLKKLSKELTKKLFSKVFPAISKDPSIGDRVINRKNLYKYKFVFKKTHYRIAYLISKKSLIVLIIKVGTRENFYKKLFKRK